MTNNLNKLPYKKKSIFHKKACKKKHSINIRVWVLPTY